MRSIPARLLRELALGKKDVRNGTYGECRDSECPEGHVTVGLAHNTISDITAQSIITKVNKSPYVTMASPPCHKLGGCPTLPLGSMVKYRELELYHSHLFYGLFF